MDLLEHHQAGEDAARRADRAQPASAADSHHEEDRPQVTRGCGHNSEDTPSGQDWCLPPVPQ